MTNIATPPNSSRAFLSFQKIKANILDLTCNMRRYDNRTQRSLFLTQNRNNNEFLNSNIPRPERTPKIRMPSRPKRQILISEAFARIKDKKFTNDGNLEMVNRENPRENTFCNQPLL